MSINSDLPPIGCFSPENVFPDRPLPNEVIEMIWNHLGDVGRATSRTVCRTWRNLSVPPSPRLHIFGKVAWEKYYSFPVEDVPAIPDNLIEITEKLRAQIKGENETPRCSLLLIPKGLSLNRLKELIQHPNIGNGSQINELLGNDWARILEVIGDHKIEQSYWILMTDTVIEYTKDERSADIKAKIEKITDGECRPPHLIEVAVSCFMNNVSSRPPQLMEYTDSSSGMKWTSDAIYLFDSKNRNNAFCQDEMDNQHVVIDFSMLGLDAFLSDDSSNFSTAVCRKFSP